MKSLRYAFVSVALLLGATATFAAEVPAGSWHGRGRIVNSWCEQETLTVSLSIAPDGAVSGKLGDATILSGKLVRRNPVMRWLGNSEWIARVTLEGDLVATEGIHRAGAIVMVDHNGWGLEGGIHSTGSKFGGKEEMVLTVFGLELTAAAAD